MTTYWCEWAWLGGPTATAGVLLEVRGDRVAAVEPGRPAPPGGELRRGLTLPGLADAHSHVFHRALRARTHGADSFWTWRDRMYDLAAVLDPDRLHRLARAVYAELALAGTTLVGEFHYLHHGPDGAPYADANALGHAVAAAADEVGVRLTLLDTCYLHGGIGTHPQGVQRRFSDGDVDAWAARSDALASGPTLGIGAAIHSVRAVAPHEMAMVAACAAERGIPLHAHVSEQPAENAQCLTEYGKTPAELLGEAGVLGSRFTAVHGTHLGPGDVALLGRHGCTVCLCPTTERDLADGVAPAAALVTAGARLALGGDSHAVVDRFEEARAVELDERLVSGRRGLHEPHRLLAAATEHGYLSLGWPRGGRLEVGALADFVTIGLGSVRLAGTPAAHLVPAAVFAAGAPDVTHVVVGGREIVRDGVHVGIDAGRELAAVLAELEEAAS